MEVLSVALYVPWPRPLVLMIIVVLGNRYVWSVDGMTLIGARWKCAERTPTLSH